MILLIDIGNSRTKYVQCSDKSQHSEQTFSAITSVNNEEFSRGYFDKNFTNISQVVLASVAANHFSELIASWCNDQAIPFIKVQSEKHKGVLTSAYQVPSKLGVDRWLVLLATTNLFPKRSALIIDAGTATTVDLVTASGQHQGGWILAGINTLVSSLLTNSTLIEANEQEDFATSFGQNTSTNVHNASWAATLGLIHQAIRQAKQECSLDEIIFTGGNGKTLANALIKDLKDTEQNPQVHVIDDLIFHGLHVYSE